jgi:hypothetical protein
MCSYQVTVGEGVQLGVAPTFHGFHPIWVSSMYQVDVCNNVDDVIIRDGETGVLYRVPITEEFLPGLDRLVRDMNTYDQMTKSPWMMHNLRVRRSLLYAATRRVHGDKPQSLNMFEPGSVAPSLDGPESTVDVDLMLAALVESSGDTRIPGQ